MAIRRGKHFNVIYTPIALKLDLFPASALALGSQELDRAVVMGATGLSDEPFLSSPPKTFILPKLTEDEMGGRVSELHRRDIEGLIRVKGGALDRAYPETGAKTPGVTDLPARALRRQ